MANQKRAIMITCLFVLQIGCVSANDIRDPDGPDHHATSNDCSHSSSGTHDIFSSNYFDEMVSAVSSGDISKIEFLTQEFDESLSPSDALALPILIAAADQNPEMIRKFIHAGYSIDSNNFFMSPLEMAASLLDEVSMTLLIENGANLNSMNCRGKTTFLALLSMASVGDDYALSADFVSYLIASGADVTRKDKSGNNALQVALKTGNYQLLKVLIEHGVSPCERNSAGKNTLDLWEEQLANGFGKYMDEETLAIQAKLECEN